MMLVALSVRAERARPGEIRSEPSGFAFRPASISPTSSIPSPRVLSAQKERAFVSETQLTGGSVEQSNTKIIF